MLLVLKSRQRMTSQGEVTTREWCSGRASGYWSQYKHCYFTRTQIRSFTSDLCYGFPFVTLGRFLSNFYDFREFPKVWMQRVPSSRITKVRAVLLGGRELMVSRFLVSDFNLMALYHRNIFTSEIKVNNIHELNIVKMETNVGNFLGICRNQV